MRRAPSSARRLASGAAEREPRSGELCGAAPASQSLWRMRKRMKLYTVERTVLERCLPGGWQ
jgi:hypothetical protein